MKSIKKFKKFLTMSLLSALFVTSSFATSVYAENTDKTDAPVMEYYKSFSGTVREINNYVDVNQKEVEGSMYLLTENKDGDIANILVTGNTYMITDTKPEVGSEIICFYEATAMEIMIYPPQRTAIAVAVDLPEGQSVEADKFDENFVNSDNMLKLNLTDDKSRKTEIVFEDNKPFEGKISELANRKMIVLYDVSTRSIPAQTTPLKVIVMYEKAVAPVSPPLPSADANTTSKMKIMVNGNETDAPTPYLDDNGVTMIPLRAVAEALGYEVTWDGETKSVMLNNIISLSIGKDYYTYARMAPIELGTAPALLKSHTYVPLNFFSSVARVPNVYIDEVENTIVINSDSNTSTSSDIILAP